MTDSEARVIRFEKKMKLLLFGGVATFITAILLIFTDLTSPWDVVFWLLALTSWILTNEFMYFNGRVTELKEWEEISDAEVNVIESAIEWRLIIERGFEPASDRVRNLISDVDKLIDERNVNSTR